MSIGPFYIASLQLTTGDIADSLTHVGLEACANLEVLSLSWKMGRTVEASNRIAAQILSFVENLPQLKQLHTVNLDISLLDRPTRAPATSWEHYLRPTPPIVPLLQNMTRPLQRLVSLRHMTMKVFQYRLEGNEALRVDIAQEIMHKYQVLRFLRPTKIVMNHPQYGATFVLT